MFHQEMFHQLEQEAEETTDQYVCQLCKNSISCDFRNVDEDNIIRDQLIGESGHPRLKELQDIAHAYAAVEEQMSSVSSM